MLVSSSRTAFPPTLVNTMLRMVWLSKPVADKAPVTASCGLAPHVATQWPGLRAWPELAPAAALVASHGTRAPTAARLTARPNRRRQRGSKLFTRVTFLLRRSENFRLAGKVIVVLAPAVYRPFAPSPTSRNCTITTTLRISQFTQLRQRTSAGGSQLPAPELCCTNAQTPSVAAGTEYTRPPKLTRTDEAPRTRP